MTGVVFDIKRYALHDGPGIRTTIFLKGCPLNCWWCHNPESKKIQPEKIFLLKQAGKRKKRAEEVFGKIYESSDIIDIIKKDILFYDESGGGVTFSGGEPLMQVDFLNELLTRSKYFGIHTAVDTSGYIKTAAYEKIINKVDLFLFDLKLMDDSEHLKYTGVSNKLIHKNLKVLTSLGKKINIRIPLIPQITDTERNLSDIIKFISGLENISKVDVLPYNEMSEGKYERFNLECKLKDLHTQSDEDLYRIQNIFNSSGYEVHIRG